MSSTLTGSTRKEEGMKKKRAVSSRVAHARLFAAMDKREKACAKLKKAKKRM